MVTREEWDSYSQKLDEHVKTNQANFEQKITYISAAVLTLSFTFISNIVKLDSAHLLSLLIIGWISLALSLTTNLTSYLIDMGHCSKVREQIASFLKDKNSDKRQKEEQEEKIKKSIETFACLSDNINWTSLLLMLLGIALIVSFITINLV